MPQTTNSQPTACARVDISATSACTPWTNVSGSVNSVQNTTQTKIVADEYTFDGGAAITQEGKKVPVDLTVRMVFTNVATEAYRLARTAFMDANCDGKLCLRWIPGGNVGDDGVQTGYMPVTAFDWPPIDANAGGPVMATFVVHAVEIDPFVFVS